jgi:formate dehydrogenase major subunit
VIEGSNMAECHPVAFRWVMRAKLQGARVIHVDPRFTRTSAMADLHGPVRAGSDIAFLGGLVHYVLESERWNADPFFQDYVRHYTNAATLVREDFRDTEELDGVFSGLMEYRGGKPEWPFNGQEAQYDRSTWQYDRPPGADRAPGGPERSFDAVIRSLQRPPPRRDETLRHPRCVLQVVRRHFARYTPEMVERVTGCPRETFLRIAETILANSGRDRTTAWVYAVGWTQHTYGPQMIGCCALLQLLLGNLGRPGGGVLALRGHASIQGSTDVPTLYHSIHGYLPAPSALARHGSLREYLAAEASPTGYWAHAPKFLVSYLKSMYGDAATPDNDFGYDWHPRIAGDHSHLPMFVAMAEGRVRGMLCVGQNPATSINASVERKAMRRLEWLVVKDNFLTETATFWSTAPEVKGGEVRPEDIETEVFFFPSAQVAETEGSFTNTQRMLQWHYKAAEPPGQCRSDLWFTHQLALRLKRLYRDSTLPRDQGFQSLVWDFDPDGPVTPPGEPDARKVLREINGFATGDPARHLGGFGELRDDGSTTCASWIYCGVFPAPDRLLAERREPDPPGRLGAHLSWGWAWPANRRVLYNRASADPAGNPWSERKRWVWWDGEGERWTGYDTPDFPLTKPPNARADPAGVGLDAHSGRHPFIMKPDGVGWLFNPAGLADGPLPSHYEPAESPIANPLYGRQTSPVFKLWRRADNPVAAPGDERYPYVLTTYRLTEHYLAGAMSRWNPWLAELMPELFVELSPELAAAKGIRNTGWVRVRTPRGEVRARALVTRRLRPLHLGGRVLHQVGMPWHWGWQGLVTGDVVNELTALVGDPNVSIHEAKAFVCDVEKA